MNRALTGDLVKLPEAMRTAQQQADASGLAQTVFKTPDTCGFHNIHAYANRFMNGPSRDLQMAVTMLPSAFFTPEWRGEA